MADAEPFATPDRKRRGGAKRGKSGGRLVSFNVIEQKEEIMNWLKKIFGFSKEHSARSSMKSSSQQLTQQQEGKTVNSQSLIKETSTDLPVDLNPPSEVTGVLSKAILSLLRTKNAESAIKTLRAVRKARGNGFYDDGKYPSSDEIIEALPLVKWATEVLPNNPIAWMARCTVLDLAVFVHYGISGYDYNDAKNEVIEVFTEVTQKAAQYPEAWIPKGFLFKQFASSPANFTTALQAFDAALKLKPGMEDALYGKAQLCDKYEDYRKALICYIELAKLYPEEKTYQRAAQELAEIVPPFLQG